MIVEVVYGGGGLRAAVEVCAAHCNAGSLKVDATQADFYSLPTNTRSHLFAYHDLVL